MVAIAALLPIPASAVAAEEAVVPPSNSAAAQYTEAFPTSGGDKKTDQAAHNRSPIEVLGSHKTKKLEGQGPEGKAAAEVAAATAPTSTAGALTGDTPSKPSNNGGGHTADEGRDSTGNAGGGSGDGGPGAPQSRTDTTAGTDLSPASDRTGSSGIGSTIGQATGLSAVGQSGPLLPLIIVATVLWSLFYLRRQRRQVG